MREAMKLSAEDREALLSVIRRPGTRPSLALRSRIILACCEGRDNRAIAYALGVSPHTVAKWRGRYLLAGLAGLVDRPRSGKPRRFPRHELQALIRRTIEAPRPDGRRWSVRSVARVVGISSATIGRAWQEFLGGRIQAAIHAVQARAYADPPAPLPGRPGGVLDRAPASLGDSP